MVFPPQYPVLYLPTIIAWVAGGVARVRAIAWIVARVGAGAWDEERLTSVDPVRVRKAIGSGNSVGIDSVQAPNRG